MDEFKRKFINISFSCLAINSCKSEFREESDDLRGREKYEYLLYEI